MPATSWVAQVTQVPTARLRQLVVEAADAHGTSSEPDHAIGDLADALDILFGLLSREQIRLFFEQYESNIDDWLSPTEIRRLLGVR